MNSDVKLCFFHIQNIINLFFFGVIFIISPFSKRKRRDCESQSLSEWIAHMCVITITPIWNSNHIIHQNNIMIIVESMVVCVAMRWNKSHKLIAYSQRYFRYSSFYFGQRKLQVYKRFKLKSWYMCQNGFRKGFETFDRINTATKFIFNTLMTNSKCTTTVFTYEKKAPLQVY